MAVYRPHRFPALELDYIRHARDVKYHEALFEIIAKQYEAARLDQAHEPILQVLDAPSVPDSKSGPPSSRHYDRILGLGRDQRRGVGSLSGLEARNCQGLVSFIAFYAVEEMVCSPFHTRVRQ